MRTFPSKNSKIFFHLFYSQCFIYYTLLLALHHVVQATREINPHSKFLYAPYIHNEQDDDDDFLLPYQTQHLVQQDDHEQLLKSSSHHPPLEQILIDYQIHLAPSGDFSGEIQEEHAKYAPGENDEERHVRPSFLFHTMPYHHHHYQQQQHYQNNHNPSMNDNIKKEFDEEKEWNHHNGNRIIQFYNPWSGPSQMYVKRFIQLAVDLNAPYYYDYYHSQPHSQNIIVDNEKSEDDEFFEVIKFYAISCSAHHWVCQDNQIQSYPTVWAFQKDSEEPIVLDWESITVKELQRLFGLVEEEIEGNVGEEIQNEDNVIVDSLSKGTSTTNNFDNGSDHDENVMKDEEVEEENLKEIDDKHRKTPINSINNNNDASSHQSAKYSTSSTLSNEQHIQPKDSSGSSSSSSSSTVEVAEINIDTLATVDILGASEFVYQRVKRETYADAIVSFTYALIHDIFPPLVTPITTTSTTDKISTADAENMQPTSYRSLTPAQKDAFSEWIDLLYWALPSNWRIHTLIHDIRSNLDQVLESREALLQLVDLHYDVVHDGHHLVLTNEQEEKLERRMQQPDRLLYRWSSACIRADHQSSLKSPSSFYSLNRRPDGYTCGLWNLIHILSIGVSERHSAVLGARDRATVVHAMHTISQYLNHFTSSLGLEFSLEEEDPNRSEKESTKSSTATITTTTTTSSAIFLKEQLSKCILHPFHHCPNLYSRKAAIPKNIFSNRQSKLPSHEKEKRQKENDWQWKQMALYIWELHNQYNNLEWNANMVAAKEKGYHVLHTKKEEKEIILWPSRAICGSCHDDYGGSAGISSNAHYRRHGGEDGWNLDEVYEFLKNEYWPNGVHNFRYVVLESRSNVQTHPEPPLLHTIRFYWIFNSLMNRSLLFYSIVGLIGMYVISSRSKYIYLERTGRHKKFETESV